ncbi:MAG: hypothetical protein ACO29O_00780, partial [Chitinophagaceae bacterium]
MKQLISIFSVIAILSSCSSSSDKKMISEKILGASEKKDHENQEAPWRGWNQYQIKPEDSL